MLNACKAYGDCLFRVLDTLTIEISDPSAQVVAARDSM